MIDAPYTGVQVREDALPASVGDGWAGSTSSGSRVPKRRCSREGTSVTASVVLFAGELNAAADRMARTWALSATAAAPRVQARHNG